MSYNSKYTGAEVEALLDKAGAIAEVDLSSLEALQALQEQYTGDVLNEMLDLWFIGNAKTYLTAESGCPRIMDYDAEAISCRLRFRAVGPANVKMRLVQGDTIIPISQGMGSGVAVFDLVVPYWHGTFEELQTKYRLTEFT